MMHTANFVAADLGASSGRIMLGQWDSRTFSIQELHRFANDAVRVGDGLYWDILGIWSHIRAGLAKYHACCPQPPLGIAVDAWGVDFGLLDRAGRLIGNPRHYRDPRTAGIPQLAFEAVAEREWFTETGVQTMPINTLFQLYSMVRAHDPALVSAETLLTIPDLCAYFLCGEKMVEWTEAATTQMYSSKRKDWARAVERLECAGQYPAAGDAAGSRAVSSARGRDRGMRLHAAVSGDCGGFARYGERRGGHPQYE
jgi:sugar (pentulose or hexulose) kinase